MPLIVLEGLDGAGKSTQMRLLREWVEREGYEAETLHFPRVETPLYGELIARFLRGEFGTAEGRGTAGGKQGVDPYALALLFAGDQADAAPTLRAWLAEGRWVLLDRYVYSNVAYQCAKVEGEAARKRLRDWILELEYETWGVPRPDVSLFLDVPARFSATKLAERRGCRGGGRDVDTEGDRDYLQGRTDVHEASSELQRRVREVYLAEACNDQTLRVIECSGEDGEMLPAAEIFEKIKNEILAGPRSLDETIKR